MRGKGSARVNRSALRPLARTSCASAKPEQIVLLEAMAQNLGVAYGLDLPVPELVLQDGSLDVKKGKEFSVGLLETADDHLWSGESYRRLGLRDRVSIAASLFLWRKTLPASAPSSEDFIRRISAADEQLPDGYINHVCDVANELFPRGWDRKYMSEVDGAVPTVKSCREMGRGKGGYRSTGPCRESYGRACMGESRISDEDLKVKYMEAQCDGKVRAVTVMSAACQRLKPLHNILYDQISKYPWLLRGEAKPSVFSSFSRVPGEVFVSGDYESASDHLPLSVAEWILRVAFRNSSQIPEEVQADALKFLRCTVIFGDQEVSATRQLMGSLLCFPLLCVQNYMAFRWVFGTSVPVKINGDDIVFRSTRAQYEVWAAFVGRVGLKLSRGKTLVSPSMFSLNSSFFRTYREGRPRLIPVVRCSSLLREKCPYPASIAGSLRRFLLGWRGETRDRLGSWFLRTKGSLIRKSGRSVVAGLRCFVTDAMLKSAGLWTRELWYSNSVPRRFRAVGFVPEEGLRCPVAPDRLLGQSVLPSGWKLQPISKDKRKAAAEREAERPFWDELVENSWGNVYTPRVLERAFWKSLSDTGYERQWVNWRCVKRDPKPIFGSVDLRSRMPSRTLYGDLFRRSYALEKVWKFVGVGEEEDEWEYQYWAEDLSFGPTLELSAYSSPETVRRRAGYERWCSRELLADHFIQ
ncbi:RNA dependent RNA polymerase [Plasmopara viticola lesion associated ourmia-like virus 36]|uniref:RNA dependent RNA polymerase n=1 Tax=Plasmopara viticola lesion associated ourmia-like virus 36 TaxID=2686505 RepID=A0ABX6FIV4_9VIRU|nr:RNA dependent RNA polymerase [Plasmopara viticola lesion associated ourmia-like virus 36]QGY72566.1 RNA dependent RNA polymerase [Plasmopara viticola lesion associated ourmia-like virus 36]